MNALEHAGTPFHLALCRPNLTSSQTDSGPIHRVSFEITKESWDALSRTDGFKRLILDGQLMMVNHDNHLVGGFQSNLAAMMCNDPHFHLFIKDHRLKKGTAVEMSLRFQQAKGKTPEQKWKDYARAWLCHGCRIESRKELDNSSVALEQFTILKRMFLEYCKINSVKCLYLGA